jgi:hypothetical protein
MLNVLCQNLLKTSIQLSIRSLLSSTFLVRCHLLQLENKKLLVPLNERLHSVLNEYRTVSTSVDVRHFTISGIPPRIRICSFVEGFMDKLIKQPIALLRLSTSFDRRH